MEARVPPQQSVHSCMPGQVCTVDQPPATLALIAPLRACAGCPTRVHGGRQLGCACRDVLAFCLQVVDVVARSHSGAVRAPKPGQNPGDPAAGRVPLAGQALGDPTAGGASAVGRVHDAGQEAGRPAASSPFPSGQAQGTSVASNSPAGVAPTSSERTCHAASSGAAAVEAVQAVQPQQGLAPTSGAAAVEGPRVIESSLSTATRGNAAAAGERRAVQPPLNLHSDAAAVVGHRAVQPPQALAPSSNAATAEERHAVQSCHERAPEGQADSSNPTTVSNLADGHQPAGLAARQAAQVGLVPATPSTRPVVSIASERHADAQVGSTDEQSSVLGLSTGFVSDTRHRAQPLMSPGYARSAPHPQQRVRCLGCAASWTHTL